MNQYHLQGDQTALDPEFMKSIVIDGNNLIYKVPGLKNKFRENKQAAVLSLIESIRTKIKRIRVIFVFDGYGEQDINSVIFSGSLTADEVIRKFIEDNYEKNELTVVSSDKGITNLAKICGCEVKNSENFWNEINHASSGKVKTGKDELNSEGEKPDRISKKDLNEFKKYFS